MRSEGLLVIVPAWNEEQALPGVLDELAAALPGVHVLVVNDGSTDGTSEIARSRGAYVLDLPVNLGVGGAMRAGYRFASHYGYAVTVQVDADGQHSPHDVPTLVAALEQKQVDVVLGARFAGVGTYETRGPRRWAMILLSQVLSRIAGVRLTDVTSGFRASNTRAIELFAAEYPVEYLGDTVESLVIAARAGLRLEQIGVGMRPRANGSPSHSPLKAAVFLGRAMMAVTIALSRPLRKTLDGTAL